MDATKGHTKPLKPLVVYERPICNWDDPTRCRRVAVVSRDGIWLCPDHKNRGAFARMFSGMDRLIIWER